mmetsp:Transcript_5400/g.17403  ORF Transcript_5400/g.17403 Transcript_5400/m.17403 type:complete len:205 (+) Transcript_5400:353-967(+)
MPTAARFSHGGAVVGMLPEAGESAGEAVRRGGGGGGVGGGFGLGRAALLLERELPPCQQLPLQGLQVAGLIPGNDLIVVDWLLFLHGHLYVPPQARVVAHDVVAHVAHGYEELLQGDHRRAVRSLNDLDVRVAHGHLQARNAVLRHRPGANPTVGLRQQGLARGHGPRESLLERTLHQGGLQVLAAVDAGGDHVQESEDEELPL